jgi:tyrosine-protein phosphatase SIW14
MKTIVFFLLLVLLQSCLSSAYKNTTATSLATDHLHNFYKLNDSLYRSAQPSAKALQEAKVLGIKSVLNLRDDASDSVKAINTGLLLFAVPITTKDATKQDIIEALQILIKAPKPLLIHCKHGADRTGIITAMYRIVMEDISKETAIKEMTDGPFGFHHQYTNLIQLIREMDIAAIKKEINLVL